MAKYLEFVLEDQNYAILVDDVRRVSQLHKIVRVPQTPKYVLGVTDYGNQIATVIDLKCLLGIPRIQSNQYQFIIYACIKNSFYALLADDVLRLIDMNVHNAQQIKAMNFKLVMLKK